MLFSNVTLIRMQNWGKVYNWEKILVALCRKMKALSARKFRLSSRNSRKAHFTNTSAREVTNDFHILKPQLLDFIRPDGP